MENNINKDSQESSKPAMPSSDEAIRQIALDAINAMASPDKGEREKAAKILKDLTAAGEAVMLNDPSERGVTLSDIEILSRVALLALNAMPVSVTNQFHNDLENEIYFSNQLYLNYLEKFRTIVKRIVQTKGDFMDVLTPAYMCRFPQMRVTEAYFATANAFSEDDDANVEYIVAHFVFYGQLYLDGGSRVNDLIMYKFGTGKREIEL